MTDIEFPQVKPNDDDGVSLALETASALWSNESCDEALRWLRKAADAAEQAGDDMRALELARAAADLRSQKQVNEAPPAEPAEPVPAPMEEASPSSQSLSLSPQRRASLPPKPAKRPLPSATAGAGTVAAADATIELTASRRPPPPSSMRPGAAMLAASDAESESIASPLAARRTSAAPPKPKSNVAPSSASSTPGADDMLAASATATPMPSDTEPGNPASVSTHDSIAAAAPPKPGASTSSSQLEAVIVAPSKPSVSTSGMEAVSIPVAPQKPAASHAPLPAALHGSSTAPNHGALPHGIESGIQVAIKPSARDSELFLVRLLGKGQPPPPGYKLAVIVTTDGTLS